MGQPPFGFVSVDALVAGLAALAMALGFWAGQRGRRGRTVSNSIHALQTLQERLIHARNMGMRLQELATTEQRLHEEQAHLALLHELKEEVNWLLAEVQSQLDRHHEEDPARLEAMIDATGKSLRLLMDAGRQPHVTWSQAADTLNHLHKTLCLIRNLPAFEVINARPEHAHLHVNYVKLSQSLIEIHRANNLDHTASFFSLDAGVEIRLSDGTRHLVLWSQDEAEA